MEKKKEQEKAKEKQQEELSKQRQIEKVTFDVHPQCDQSKMDVKLSLKCKSERGYSWFLPQVCERVNLH